MLRPAKRRVELALAGMPIPEKREDLLVVPRGVRQVWRGRLVTGPRVLRIHLPEAAVFSRAGGPPRFRAACGRVVEAALVAGDPASVSCIACRRAAGPSAVRAVPSRRWVEDAAAAAFEAVAASRIAASAAGRRSAAHAELSETVRRARVLEFAPPPFRLKDGPR